MTFCVAYSGISGAIVSFIAPLAAGSGIPEIKTYLNGVHIKGAAVPLLIFEFSKLKHAIVVFAGCTGGYAVDLYRKFSCQQECGTPANRRDHHRH